MLRNQRSECAGIGDRSFSRLGCTFDYITGVHAAHHVDMNRGNFATLTMVYDRLFGTYEEPVSRTSP